MTAPNQDQTTEQPADNSKELNFRALEQKHKREIQQMQAEYEKKMQEYMRPREPEIVDDDDDDDPYVDKKRLDKKLSSFEKKLESKFDEKVSQGARKLLEKEKQENWIKSHPDFYDTLQNHSEDFAKVKPLLAESILRMPEGFERQQLVYENIKALGIGVKKDDSIQDTVTQRQQGPYYQPTGISPSAYAGGGDYTPSGQKNAYEKMKELQQRLRM